MQLQRSRPSIVDLAWAGRTISISKWRPMEVFLMCGKQALRDFRKCPERRTSYHRDRLPLLDPGCQACQTASELVPNLNTFKVCCYRSIWLWITTLGGFILYFVSLGDLLLTFRLASHDWFLTFDAARRIYTSKSYSITVSQT